METRGLVRSLHERTLKDEFAKQASGALAQAQEIGRQLPDLIVEQLRIRHASGLLMSGCVVASNFCRDSLPVEGRWAIDANEGAGGRRIGSNA